MYDDDDDYFIGFDVDEMPGCCAVSVFYELGSAENVPPAKNQKEFFEALLNESYNRVLMATTIKSQSKERLWLRRAGFKTRTCGDIYIHYGWTIDIKAKINEFLNIKKKAKFKK